MKDARFSTDDADTLLKELEAAGGREVHTFSTGAVRSTDADSERWDLISPIAMREISQRLAEGFQPHENANRVAQALDKLYRFLAGEGTPLLAEAAICVLSAIQARCGAPDWIYLERSAVSSDDGFTFMPFRGLRSVAETCHEGAIKYDDFNWEKGMPAHSLLNHAIRHGFLDLSGDRTECHLAHMAWNIFGAIHSVCLWPELNKGTLRTYYCKPPVEDESETQVSWEAYNR